MSTRLITRIILVLFLFSFSGCSVVMAVRQPEYKNTKIVKNSVSREELIAEFGIPKYTEKTADGRMDVFSFKQGYGKGNKAARVFFHSAADIFSLFLWEVIGTPSEMIANGHEVKFKVVYDNSDKVTSYEFFDDRNKK